MNMWTTNKRAPIFVYVFSSEHMGCKIGVTKNPDYRRQQVQSRKTGRVQIEFLSKVAGACWIEATAHALLIDHPHEYEWFQVAPDVAIDAVLTAFELSARKLYYTPIFRVPGGGKRELQPRSRERLIHALAQL